MDINKCNAYDLLINNKNIEIPYFQRKYTWGKEEILKLIEDVRFNNSDSYYLGSILFKNNSSKKC